MAERKNFPLFCIGNPLLDIQVTNGEKLLEKYNLKANDAILASPEQMSMWDPPCYSFVKTWLI